MSFGKPFCIVTLTLASIAAPRCALLSQVDRDQIPSQETSEGSGGAGGEGTQGEGGDPAGGAASE